MCKILFLGIVNVNNKVPSDYLIIDIKNDFGIYYIAF